MGKSRKILLVDDEAGIRNLLFHALSCNGFNVSLAKDGQNSLDQMQNHRFGLLITDINMPRLDGIELLKKMKKAGCIHIAYGVESGNQTVLNKIPKNVTLDQIRAGVRLTKKVGIPSVSGFFMLGLIGDTKKTMEDTIKFAKSLDLDKVSISLTTPYPGTRLFEEIKKNGKFLFNFKNWEDYHHTSGRMSFTHPDVAPPEVVEDMYQKYYKEFFFRQKYIIKQVLKIRSFGQLQMMSRGLIAIIKSSMKKQPTMK